jgi:hypothetical protein
VKICGWGGGGGGGEGWGEAMLNLNMLLSNETTFDPTAKENKIKNSSNYFSAHSSILCW